MESIGPPGPGRGGAVQAPLRQSVTAPRERDVLGDQSVGLLARLADGFSQVGRLDMPEAVAHEALRALLNIVGPAVASSSAESVEQALTLQQGHEICREVIIPGRSQRYGLYTAAIGTGMAAHLDDFDDTHLESGNMHVGSVALAATLGIADVLGVSGRQFLIAFALTCETLIRLGLAMAPSHHGEGWQPSSTCGPIAAAGGVGLLLGLDTAQMTSALALGSTRMLGQREALGTAAKSFHAGKAAANGLVSATMAASGLSTPASVFEAPQGVGAVLSQGVQPSPLLEGFGRDWHLLSNTYKAYPCGVVAHPGIDVALFLAPSVGDPSSVAAVTYDCHPLVKELMDRPEPSSGLEARFSAQHVVSSAMACGELTLAQLSDEMVQSPPIQHLRSLVKLEPNGGFDREEAALTVHMDDGRRLYHRLRGPRGSVTRPLTDEELKRKTARLAEPILRRDGEELAATIFDLPGAASVSELLVALTPKPMTEYR